MELGGAERALLGLLEILDVSQYDVDLFLMRHSGEMLKDIPYYVNLLPENYYVITITSVDDGYIGVLETEAE